MSSRRDPNWDLYSHPDEDMEESPDAGRQDSPSDSDTEMEFEDVLFTTQQPTPPPAQPATTTPEPDTEMSSDDVLINLATQPTTPPAQPATPTASTPTPVTPASLRSQGGFFMTGVIPVPAQPEAGDCGVCMDALTEDVVKLKCGHYYHTTCIHTWLTEHRTCPYCRRVLYENTGPSREAELFRTAPRPTLTPQTRRGTGTIRESFRARINRSLDRTPTPEPRRAPAPITMDVRIRGRSNTIAARRERVTGVRNGTAAIAERMERFTQELQEVPAINDVGALVVENRAAGTPRAPRTTPQMPRAPHPFDEWALDTDSSNNPPTLGEFATRPGPNTPTRTRESIMARRGELRSASDHASTPRTPRRDPAAGDSDFSRMLRRSQAEAGHRHNPATSVAPAFAPTLPRRGPALRDFTPGRAGDPTSTPRPSFLDPVPEQAEPMTEQQRNDLITRAAVRLSSVEFAQFINTLPAASADNTFTPDPSESVGALLLEEDGDSPSLPDAESPSPSPRPCSPIYATIPPFTAAHISPDLLARARAIAARNRHWFQDEEFFGFPSTNRVVNEPGFANLDVSIRERIFRQTMAELEDMNEMNDSEEIPALSRSSSSSSEDEGRRGFFDNPAERQIIMSDIEDHIADIEDDPAERQRMMRDIEDEIAEFEEEIPQRRARGSPNIEDEIADFEHELVDRFARNSPIDSPDDESD